MRGGHHHYLHAAEQSDKGYYRRCQHHGRGELRSSELRGGGLNTVRPTVTGVTVLTGLTIQVSFSKTMLAPGITTAANYALSGAGQGSLATNPSSVAGAGPYVPTWASGEMLNGATVTMTVTGVQDTLGNLITTPDSGNGTGIGTSPTVTINQAVGQADPTRTSPINFTVVFSEPINPATFTGGDVAITGTAGGAKSVALSTSDNITWNAQVTGMTTTGTVIAGIAAGMCTDPAGNPNTTSSSSDNTVT